MSHRTVKAEAFIVEDAALDWGVRWLKECSRDSDPGECWLHHHKGDQPCTADCRQVKDGKVQPRGPTPVRMDPPSGSEGGAP